eukprot:2855343-Prymnesium_polylepis.1
MRAGQRSSRQCGSSGATRRQHVSTRLKSRLRNRRRRNAPPGAGWGSSASRVRMHAPREAAA